MALETIFVFFYIVGIPVVVALIELFFFEKFY